MKLTVASGHDLNLRDLQPKDIQIEDIAHALARLCRFAGHVPWFYSVAQHSVTVARLVPPELALAALLHDASEAYLADIPTHVKYSPELEGYRRLEEDIQTRIFRRFGLPAVMDERIKLIDHAVGELEFQALLINPDYPFIPQPFLVNIEEAEEGFLEVFHQLNGVQS